jgi:hypothetical protein
MTTATVFQYGNRSETTETVELPAVVVESYPCLIDGTEQWVTQEHRLSPGEEYGVGSAGNYRIVEK